MTTKIVQPNEAQIKAASQMRDAIKMFSDSVCNLVSGGDASKRVGPAEVAQLYSIFMQGTIQLMEFWEDIMHEWIGTKQMEIHLEDVKA